MDAHQSDSTTTTTSRIRAHSTSADANEIVVVRAYYQWPTNKIFGSLVAEEPVQRQAPDRLFRGLPQRALQRRPREAETWQAIEPALASTGLRQAAASPGSPAASHESGMAAVEFSLILPIMVLLWIGGVEVTQALSVDRRLEQPRLVDRRPRGAQQDRHLRRCRQDLRSRVRARCTPTARPKPTCKTKRPSDAGDRRRDGRRGHRQCTVAWSRAQGDHRLHLTTQAHEHRSCRRRCGWRTRR